jgi:hypothetical protein
MVGSPVFTLGLLAMIKPGLMFGARNRKQVGLALLGSSRPSLSGRR